MSRETRSFKERMQEVADLERRHHEEQDDQAYVDKIERGLGPTWQERLHQLQNPEIESRLREQMNLPAKKPLTTGDHTSETVEDQLRERLHLRRKKV